MVKMISTIGMAIFAILFIRANSSVPSSGTGIPFAFSLTAVSAMVIPFYWFEFGGMPYARAQGVKTATSSRMGIDGAAPFLDTARAEAFAAKSSAWAMGSPDIRSARR